jgi:predicted nuclease of restriction endonuclease-like (RecB) superfamily
MNEALPSDSVYRETLHDLVTLLEHGRRAAARSVNALMTATYWRIGQRIVESEQRGEVRATYGAALLRRLAQDLTERFGRGFGVDNLELMRLFYVAYPSSEISESPIRKLPQADRPQKSDSATRISLQQLAERFPLSWTHYVHLIRRTRSPEERHFYETEALRGGWSVRQLDRQIGSQFYARTLMSTDKRAMLERGREPLPDKSRVTPEAAIKDPYVLEFLDLKDEYSETQLEEALIHRLEDFLLELGGDFAFVGRQRRLRIGDSWFRVDLLFFHRRLRCLVIIDLKLTELTHADVGQMHMYCNYAKEHWTLEDENPPVGLILCARTNAAIARYALDGLPNKVLAAEYHMLLPDEAVLAEELARTRREWEAQRPHRPVSDRPGD